MHDTVDLGIICVLWYIREGGARSPPSTGSMNDLSQLNPKPLGSSSLGSKFLKPKGFAEL